MKIKHITVKKLFGIFDHNIPMNMDDRITILFGPNGFGKTFVLKLVTGFLNSEYGKIQEIPFDDLTVVFDDDSTLRLVNNQGGAGEKLTVEYTKKDSQTKLYHPSKDEPEWLREMKNNVRVQLINTERLIQFSGEDMTGGSLAVKKYADELKELIEEKLAEYATLSQSLDRTFPVRLVKGGTTSELTLDELKKLLRELEHKRSRLADAGILDRGKIDLTELEKIGEGKRDVLSVYIGDAEKKLSVFDELTCKIELFVRIVNKKFLHKRLEINKNDGFVFTASDGKILQPENLSSGEQHAVVLFYQLLFKVLHNSLILIDEPELSLHIVWQQQFIRDIHDIIELDGFDVLIATHSPQIIHDRWDLAVELKEPRS